MAAVTQLRGALGTGRPSGAVVLSCGSSSPAGREQRAWLWTKVSVFVSILLLLSRPTWKEGAGPGQRFSLFRVNFQVAVSGPRESEGNYIHFVQKFRNKPHMTLLKILDTWI